MRVVNSRPIRNAAENEAAIELVQRIDQGTPEQHALGELMTLLIEELMEERGHTQLN